MDYLFICVHMFILSACAGDGFSIFWTDLGVVLSCGDNSKGCLGQSDVKNYNEPKVIGKHRGYTYKQNFKILMQIIISI